MSDQYIYQFTINETKEVVVPETTTDESGNEVIVNKKEIQQVPVKYALKRPTKAQKNDIDIFNKVEFSKAVKLGILPVALLQKNLDDSGGVLSKADIKLRDELIEKITVLQKEATELKENDPKVEILNGEIMNHLRDIQEINSKEIRMYNNTAEGVAKNSSISYMMGVLSLKADDAGNYKPFFAGDSHEVRLESMEAIDRDGPEHELKALQVFLATANALWSNDRLRQEDLDKYFVSIGLVNGS